MTECIYKTEDVAKFYLYFSAKSSIGCSVIHIQLSCQI